MRCTDSGWSCRSLFSAYSTELVGWSVWLKTSANVCTWCNLLPLVLLSTFVAEAAESNRIYEFTHTQEIYRDALRTRPNWYSEHQCFQFWEPLTLFQLSKFIYLTKLSMSSFISRWMVVPQQWEESQRHRYFAWKLQCGCVRLCACVHVCMCQFVRVSLFVFCAVIWKKERHSGH